MVARDAATEVVSETTIQKRITETKVETRSLEAEATPDLRDTATVHTRGNNVPSGTVTTTPVESVTAPMIMVNIHQRLAGTGLVITGTTKTTNPTITTTIDASTGKIIAGMIDATTDGMTIETRDTTITLTRNTIRSRRIRNSHVTTVANHRDRLVIIAVAVNTVL